MKEWKKLSVLLVVFLGCYYFPLEYLHFRNPIFEAFALVKWYAREHVLLCLIPAFFIAGAVSVFIKKSTVIKCFGAKANKFLAYSVASVSGTILAVCSCTVLPLFSGIYKRGAGIGPAVAFLYSGPAINVLAIVMTARILGWELGLARAVGAILFSVVIGLSMHLIFLKDERARIEEADFRGEDEEVEKPLWKNVIYFAAMISILVFANWGSFQTDPGSIWEEIFRWKWIIVAVSSVILILVLYLWFTRGEIKEWVAASWRFTKQIMPLLLGGVIIAGLLLGRPGNEGFMPAGFIKNAVGGNSIFANLCASVVGAFMYFATLTEVPILQGLIGSGMGKGPSLALLLAGPALSLPTMIVIKSVMGLKKTLVYVSLVVAMATISGLFFGWVTG